MSRMRRTMRIGELETRSGCSRDTIHFYVREGLLHPPVRTSATTADWDDAHVDRLARIRVLRDEGVALSVIARVLAEGGGAWSLETLRRLGSLLAALGVKGGSRDAGAAASDVARSVATSVRARLEAGEDPRSVAEAERSRALAEIERAIDDALHDVALSHVGAKNTVVD